MYFKLDSVGMEASKPLSLFTSLTFILKSFLKTFQYKKFTWNQF